MEERETQVLRLVPQENDQAKVTEEARKFLERCEKGEVKSFLLFEEGQKDFKWTRCNMMYSNAFMGCHRMAYRLNQDWDDMK